MRWRRKELHLLKQDKDNLGTQVYYIENFYEIICAAHQAQSALIDKTERQVCGIDNLRCFISKEVEQIFSTLYIDHDGGINDFGIEEFDSRRCFVVYKLGQIDVRYYNDDWQQNERVPSESKKI
ncbi:20014_t:CDS:2, partial [Racocetra persica]